MGALKPPATSADTVELAGGGTSDGVRTLRLSTQCIFAVRPDQVRCRVKRWTVLLLAVAGFVIAAWSPVASASDSSRSKVNQQLSAEVGKGHPGATSSYGLLLSMSFFNFPSGTKIGFQGKNSNCVEGAYGGTVNASGSQFIVILRPRSQADVSSSPHGNISC